MMIYKAFVRIMLALFLFFAAAQLTAAQVPAGTEFFESRVRPIFVQQCSGCHNETARKAGLVLITPEGIARGADSGAILSKDDPASSKLLLAIGYHERIKMPPTGKLPDQQIADITAWVKSGAPLPAVNPAAAAPAKKREYTKAQKQFWSFRPVKDYPVPAVQNTAWVKSPVDAFILARLEAKGLKPAPPTDKVVLLRRATFDLTGLPPTRQELDDFLADRSPDAFAKVVDRLLASPRYGERWGRHWLDVARYADSTGADEDHRYPHAWRYRDYVIEAFNRDLPYDQFVREQIAGDLLPAPGGKVNVNGVVATGFLALGPRLIAEQDKVKMLYDFIDEQIDTTTRGILGLTVACARCHDHKFDPISTKDYYSLASIFASSKGFKKIEGTVSQMHFTPLVEAGEFAAYEAHQNRIAARKRELDILTDEQGERYALQFRPQLAAYMKAAWKACHQGAREEDLAAESQLDSKVLRRWIEYLQPTEDVRPHLSRWYAADARSLESTAAAYQREFEAAANTWHQKLVTWKNRISEAAAKGEMPPDRPKVGEAANRFFVEVLMRGGPFALGEKERHAFYPQQIRERAAALKREIEELTKNAPPEPALACGIVEGSPVEQRVFVRGDAGSPGEPVTKRFPIVLAGENQQPIERGSGRLQLAHWLASKDNPLTARVLVNRVWQWHFGEGLVRTPSNWGLLGEKPTHPELLDFLASRFVESGWSIKKLHRTLMLSSAYQMSSEITREKASMDAANRLWSRFQRRRLDVEEIRDGMLAIDGTLDVTMGGTLQKGTGTDGENAEGRRSIDPATSKRRTVYLPLRRSNLPTVLNLFDFGDATTTLEARSRTNVAPQALFMMNSEFVRERATTLAELTLKASDNPQQRVETAYLKVLSRRPSTAEIASALDYVNGAGDRGWPSLYRVLLASNEFVYVD